MRLIFATGNRNKLNEIRSVAPKHLEIAGLDELGFEGEIPETMGTIEGNSLQKAEFISNKYSIPCFAEDTGLEVDALNGEPGVYSARYAGPEADANDNTKLLLERMNGLDNRSARFKTVITYYNQGSYVQFTGTTHGTITEVPIGEHGFGYDPVFIPEDSGITYAQMTLSEKNKYSHRKKSFELFATYLESLNV